MEKKTKPLKFVRNEIQDKANSEPSESNIISNSTPVKESKKPRIWENDMCSQESNDIDVQWDWDSPKNIKPKILYKIRKELQKSPKLPKKTSQVDHVKNFEKLREELQALRNEIARFDDDCLVLSLDEQTFREESAKESNDISSFMEEQYLHIENQETENFLKMDENLMKNQQNDLFNTSCDEQLILCTQMIEENLLNTKIENIKAPALDKLQQTDSKQKKDTISETHLTCFSKKKTLDSTNSLLKRVIDENPMDVRTVNLGENIKKSMNNDFGKSILCRSADDSFDAVLKDFEDEDIAVLTQTNNNNNNVKTFVPRKFQASPNFSSSFKRTFSDANVQYNPEKVGSVKISKFTFHRTHSFESATTKKDDLPKHVMEEIERKRNEALAKLKGKKEKEKHQAKTTDETYNNVSPLKCSPEEIEQKRLQAQAIRNSKQKEIIERNRLEALKRLEMNRQKRLGSNSKIIQDKVIK